MRKCSVDGCLEKHEAKGYCHSHYKRFMRHGDPLTVKQGSPGSGWIDKKGYKYNTENGKAKRENRVAAERVFGHDLPKGSVVHHIDEDRRNNQNNNLVICQSYGYHRQLHARLDALKQTGHADWQKCPYCHKYDNPQNMVKEKVRFLHRECRNLLQTKMREDRHASCV